MYYSGARLFRKETCNTKTERKKEERESERKKGKNKGDYETLKSTGNTFYIYVFCLILNRDGPNFIKKKKKREERR